MRRKEEAVEVKPWIREAAKELVEANADRGRTYDNAPDYLETAQIIAKHAPVASPPAPEQVQSRSFLRRVAAMKGELAPTFVAADAPDGLRKRFEKWTEESGRSGAVYDLRRNGAGYYWSTIQEMWEACQFGADVITHRNDVYQVGSASASPPQRLQDLQQVCEELVQKELVIDIARELYDRFVMGGASPEDVHAWLHLRLIESSAETPEKPVAQLLNVAHKAATEWGQTEGGTRNFEGSLIRISNKLYRQTTTTAVPQKGNKIV